jgi:hypothetical protein
MGRRTVVGIALLLTVLALTAAGCGGDDEPETSATVEWADGFCTAVSAWTSELERIGDSLTSSLSSDALDEAAGDVSSATDDFVEDVRGLGAPDTDSGQAVQDSIETLADTVEAEKVKIEDAVESASGLTGAAQAVATLGTSLAAMATAFQTMFQAIEDADVDGELETAFEESTACDELSG